MAAELAVRADFAGDTGHFGGETAQLIHHGINRIFQLQELAAHIDGDLFRQVAIGDGNRHVGDVAHLARQVAGHHVDAFSKILPDAAHVAHLRLAAELALGADLAGNTGDFGGKAIELLHHRVNHFRRTQELAPQRLSFSL